MKMNKFLGSLIVAVFLATGGMLTCGASQADDGSTFILPQYSKKVSLDFKNADLKDVLKAFSKQLGVNFITTKDVGQVNITVFLENVPVEDALGKILTANGFTYEYDQVANIFLVKTTPPSLDEAIVTRVFQLRFATVSESKVQKTLDADSSTDTGLTATSSSSSSSSTSSSSSSSSTDGTGISGAIKAALKSKEFGKVVEDPRTNSIIVTDVQSNFPAIERILARLDAPIPQVMIEIEMIDVSKNAVDTLGMKYANGANILSISPTNTVTDSTGNSITEHTPDMNGAEHTGYSRYGNLFKFWEEGTLDLKLSAVLDFLRTQTDSKVLARPRIMTLDNQTAQIRVATNEAIGLKSLQSDTTTGTITVEAERVDTGILLTVTPQVSLLTDEVTLVVEPKVIEAKQGGTFGTYTFLDPEERSVKAILKVKSGDTIMMGGLVRTAETEIISKFPLLGDIPLLGYIFKHKSKTKVERELIVFMTPRILDGNSVSPNVLKGDPAVREQSTPEARLQTINNEMDRALKTTSR